MFKRDLINGTGARVLLALGALDPSEKGRNIITARHAEIAMKARAQVDRHIENALPNAKSDWRNTLPMVEANLAGQARPDLSRQEVRAMKRDIAKSEASLQRTAARREAKMAKKRRRAGLVQS